MPDTVSSADNISIEAGSFQDRTSRIVYRDEKIYRVLNRQAFENWERFADTRLYRNTRKDGRLVGTRLVTSPGFDNPFPEIEAAAILEHDRIPVVSYPYEWPFGMLKDAALLHLDLLGEALDENFTIKDATAYNVQWQGVKPVFIDTPSFEPLPEGQAWIGYRQFCQMFLYPLMLQAYREIAFHPWMRGSVQGITPHDMNQLLRWQDRLRPGVFTHVYLHARLQDKYADPIRQKQLLEGIQAAHYRKELIQNNVRQLQKVVGNLTWKQARSTWSGYTENNSYSQDETADKMRFVEEVAGNRHRRQVWDIGCNTGVFSEITAKYADTVLALDADHLSVERLYQRLKGGGSRSNILPMVANLADPAPDLGWRCRERKTLAGRSKPDLVLCLALIHHMVIRHNIPLREFVDWLGSLNSDVVIEFVTKDDVMVRSLLLGKADQYHDYEQPYFEQCLARWFDIRRREVSRGGSRILYHATPKAS